MAVNPHSIFGFLLREAGFVEAEVAQIVQVGGQVAAIASTFPSVNPSSLFGEILKLLGIAEAQIPRIQEVGEYTRVVIDILQQVEGAADEFQAGQEVTGSISLYGHKYAFDFKPVA